MVDGKVVALNKFYGRMLIHIFQEAQHCNVRRPGSNIARIGNTSDEEFSYMR